MKLLSLIAPQLLLIAVACALFFFGLAKKPATRRMAAMVAFVTLAGVFAWQLGVFLANPGAIAVADDFNAVRVGAFATFINALACFVGAIFVLMAWPSNADGTGSASHNFGSESGEFFGLALLALTGVMLVAAANDLILLFLAIELAAIPTYIMVSISRPLPVAQEAGVKYFFLGAMAAAVMLFGFSYLYGTTGQTRLDAISATVAAAARGEGPAGANPDFSTWLMLGTLVLLAGFAFKIAAVPMHAYAGDVYQGAATPVTALIAFVPKTSGFVAIIKILAAVGGAAYLVPDVIVKLLWVVAVVSMSFGNVLALLQQNVKRVFAYSSIAHSGYMLVGVTALVSAARHSSDPAAVQSAALQGVLFYLAAYGMMNTGAFAVLMLIPARPDRGHHSSPQHPLDEQNRPLATTAETYEDLAGQGRRHPVIGLAMSVCCLSLIGLPMTVGFLGKASLLMPALNAGLVGLAVIVVVNSAVSAAYYLKIVTTLFIRLPPPDDVDPADHSHAHVHPLAAHGLPLTAGMAAAVIGTLYFGLVLPSTDALTSRLGKAGVTIGRPAPLATVPTTPPADNDAGMLVASPAADAVPPR